MTPPLTRPWASCQQDLVDRYLAEVNGIPDGDSYSLTDLLKDHEVLIVAAQDETLETLRREKEDLQAALTADAVDQKSLRNLHVLIMEMFGHPTHYPNGLSILAIVQQCKQERDEFAGALERLRAAQTWQPIETAPKDGTCVLLLNQNCAVSPFDRYIGAYRRGMEYEPSPHAVEWRDYAGRYSTPTHWMKLPEGLASASRPTEAP